MYDKFLQQIVAAQMFNLELMLFKNKKYLN